MSPPISACVYEEIERLFLPGQVAEIERLLLEFGTESYECRVGLDRIRLDILAASKGNIERVRELVKLAKTDYRDLIMVAEYDYRDSRHVLKPEMKARNDVKGWGQG